MHHIIIGGGPAGLIAAETIRKLAPFDNISIISDEPEPAYSRMAIPYLLMGKVDEHGTHLRKSATHVADLKINWVQASVKSVNVASKTIALSTGKSTNLDASFDTLLIASGSHPIAPPIPGINSEGVHTCWTLADARHIMAKAGKGTRVLQLGAGFIGCIIMEALAARGVILSVVEMGDRMVPRMMGPAAGGMIRQWCEGKGVEVFTSTKVESIEAGKPLKVKLSNGKTVEADLLISAAGVRPAIGYLKDSGVECLLGVLTDAHLQTNVPGIYAAGDCAEAYDKISNKTIVSAIQPNAAEQARCAAINMVAYSRGEPAKTELKGVTQINVLDTLGLISCSFGNWQGVSGGE
ncbi:MAG TPA: NAD(P)/FAD-dependent oxidoreductase, partial [Burkholderiaceae bacterium]|nr:NAD(P)/FAD-dependent oxidoreductase [Burkholderiaceae bacterium]